MKTKFEAFTISVPMEIDCSPRRLTIDDRPPIVQVSGSVGDYGVILYFSEREWEIIERRARADRAERQRPQEASVSANLRRPLPASLAGIRRLD